MILHIAISTTYANTDSPALLHLAAHLGSWRWKIMLVEIFCGGIYAPIEPGRTLIDKLFNSDAGNLPAVDSQRHRDSGRYRRKQTVPT